jgi:hypothetical protein
MKMRSKGFPIRKHMVLFFSLFLLFGMMVSPSYGNEEKNIRYGFSVLGGPEADSRADILLFAFLPRVDLLLHRNWELEFEGNLSYYGISESKNLYLLGVNTNILYKLIQWKKGSFFLLGGGGLAYDNSNGHVKNVGNSHFAGVLQGGGGVYLDIGKGLLLRVEYRYQHISEPFISDAGLNTHNFALGVSF